MRTLLLAFALAGVLAPLACAGVVAPGDGKPVPSSSSSATETPTSTTTGSATGTPTGTPTGSSTGSDPTFEACGQSVSQSPITFASSSDMLAHLGKVWRACPGAPHGLGALGGPGGFEVGPDGHYYALGLDASGGLTRMTGFANEAELVDGLNPTELVFGDGGFRPLEVQLSSDGRTLKTFDEGGSWGPFVASQAPVAIQPVEPKGAREGASGCGVSETNILPQPASAAAAEAALLGRWIGCAGGAAFPAVVAGLQFNADGTWAFLVGGALAPSTDPQYSGSYSYVSTGTGQWQLNLATAAPNGGTFILAYAMSESPVKLELDNEGGITVMSAE